MEEGWCRDYSRSFFVLKSSLTFTRLLFAVHITPLLQTWPQFCLCLGTGLCSSLSIKSERSLDADKAEVLPEDWTTVVSVIQGNWPPLLWEVWMGILYFNLSYNLKSQTNVPFCIVNRQQSLAQQSNGTQMCSLYSDSASVFCNHRDTTQYCYW